MTTVALLDRSRIVAGPGWSRWLLPPAAPSIHLAIGSAYAWSVFKIPLEKSLHISGTAGAMPFTIAIVMVGLRPAAFGTRVDHYAAGAARRRLVGARAGFPPAAGEATMTTRARQHRPTDASAPPPSCWPGCGWPCHSRTACGNCSRRSPSCSASDAKPLPCRFSASFVGGQV